MKYTVVTSFSQKGYGEYAHRFMNTFERHWPSDVELLVYHEGTNLSERRCIPINILTEVGSCMNFLEVHKDSSIVNGTVKAEGHKWKAKCEAERYNFRFDADKFCRKVFAIEHAADIAENGLLFWIDADVIFTRDMPKTFLDLVMPQGYTLSYLQRWDYYHSECGFIGYNLNDVRAHNFIIELAKKYRNGTFLNHKEWHDSYLFDRVMEEVPNKAYPIPSSNMRKVFDTSLLGNYMLHLKGDLKSIVFKGEKA